MTCFCQASAPCRPNETTTSHWFYSRAKGACLEEQVIFFYKNISLFEGNLLYFFRNLQSCKARRKLSNQFLSVYACKAKCSPGLNNNNNTNQVQKPIPLFSSGQSRTSFLTYFVRPPLVETKRLWSPRTLPLPRPL